MNPLGFFRWENIISEDEIMGEIPSNKMIYKHIFDIAWPSAVESILIALIAAVDMMMVGSLGANSISAVGICTQPKYVVLASIMALNNALTSLISRRKGENDSKRANRYLKNALLISSVITIVLSVSAIIFADPVLRFAGANNEYIDLAVIYFRIIMIGNIFYSIGLTISAAQRGIGNTRVALQINMVANVVNLILNYCLINGHFGFPALGVRGAAIATTIGNIIAFMIGVRSLLSKERFISLYRFDKSFDLNSFKDIFKVGKSTFIEQVFLRIGFFTYAKSVAGLGTIAFAAHQVTMNIMSISFSFGDGLSIANSSIVGQSLGQKRPDLAKINANIARNLGVVIALVAASCIAIFRIQILGLFTNDPIVIQTASIPMLILSVCVLFQIPQVITVGSLRGAGDVKFVAALMLISVTFVRPGLSYLLSYALNWGLIGAWLAVFLDQGTRNLVSSYRFKNGDWINIKL